MNRAKVKPDARLLALAADLEKAIKNWRRHWNCYAAAQDKGLKAERLEMKEAAANDAAGDLAIRILSMKPQTLEGILAKLKAAAWLGWGEENPRIFEGGKFSGDAPATICGGDAEALYRIGCDVAQFVRKAA